MLKKLEYIVPVEWLTEAQFQIPNIDFKITINKPTGNFFYDPWVIDDIFKGTIWEKIYESLPMIKGEARIIKLDTTQSYTSHGDIDDRYHLNIIGSSKSYLVDLENDILYKTETDCTWYDMDAGRLHSAVNFNDQPRYQLVVRQLLKDNRLIDPVKVKIVPNINRHDHRFMFDQHISIWLNRANKSGIINDFQYIESECLFNIERNHLDNLKEITPGQFNIV